MSKRFLVHRGSLSRACLEATVNTSLLFLSLALYLEAVIGNCGWRLRLFILSSPFHGDPHMTILPVWQGKQARNSTGVLPTAKTMDGLDLEL